MKKLIFAALLFSISVAIAGTASAQASHFQGTWKNVDSHTRGLVELKINVHGLDVDVKAFGACTPTPCDVGNTDAHLFAPNVSANLEQNARILIVRYHESFAERLLVIEPRGPNEIAAQMYTHFTDSSHRTNYFESGVFKR